MLRVAGRRGDLQRFVGALNGERPGRLFAALREIGVNKSAGDCRQRNALSKQRPRPREPRPRLVHDFLPQRVVFCGVRKAKRSWPTRPTECN